MRRINGEAYTIRDLRFSGCSGEGSAPQNDSPERLEMYIKRYENGEDLWSGEKLPEELDTSK